MSYQEKLRMKSLIFKFENSKLTNAEKDQLIELLLKEQNAMLGLLIKMVNLKEVGSV